MNQESATRSALLKAGQSFARSRGRPALLYFMAADAIGMPNVRDVAKCVGEDHFEELDIIIDSSGGDIHAAYRLVSLLRLHTKHLIACVPRHARSAATLLCLGADSIFVEELSALGPLDAQVYEGLNEDSTQRYASALNAFKALERLRDFSLDTLQVGAEFFSEVQLFRPEDVLKHALEFVQVTTAPLFDKIESHKLGEFSQALAIGEEYGRRLLAQTAPTISEDKRDDLIRQLVHGYPSHEYVIDHQELSSLGLQVALFEGEQGRLARRLADSAERLAKIEKNTCVAVVHPDRVIESDDGEPDASTAGTVSPTEDDADGSPPETTEEIPQAPVGSRHQAPQTVFRRVEERTTPGARNPWRRSLTERS